MTPPAEQFALEAARPVAARRAAGIGSFLLAPGRVVTLVDGLVIAFLLLALRIFSGTLNPQPVLFLLLVLFTQINWTGERTAVNVGALEDAAPLGKAVVFSFALVSAVGTLTNHGDPRNLLALTAIAFPALFVGRMASHALERRAARAGALSRTLIVGSGELAARIVKALQEDEDYGLEVVGAIDQQKRLDSAKLGTRMLGTPEDLIDIVKSRRIETIVVAEGSSPVIQTVDALRAVLEMGVQVWAAPRYHELGADTGRQHIGSVPVVKLSPPASMRQGWKVKRALDLAVAGTGFLVLSPLLALIAAAVKLDSKGTVLFKQERVGKDGKHFNILKFRTMAPCSDLRSKTEWEADENRITRVGMVLRKTGLDELPQLLNVLKGELTLVGPRPERPIFVQIFDEMYPHYSDRHRVPSGITGWAQVNGLRGDTSIEDRARFDNFYIEHWSFGRDLKIGLLTLRTFMKRYRGKVAGDTESSGETTKTDISQAS